MRSCRISLIAALIAGLMGSTGWGQEAGPSGLRIELNATDEMQNACRLSFLVESALSEDITKAVYEAVLFDQDGRVNRLSLFDFGSLPAGRPRVRQFVVPDLPCAELGRVLINGVTQCDSASLGDDACMTGLDLVSRTDVEVIG